MQTSQLRHHSRLWLSPHKHNSFDWRLAKILTMIAALAMIISLTPAVFADTTLTLDSIPGHAYEGQTVTFTGVLYADGRPLAGKVVYIQDDDSNAPDDLLAKGRTDQNGRFHITWMAYQSDPTNTIEIYATFKGDSFHEKDRTRNQEMDVFERRSTQVTLNPIPGSVYVGDAVTFTGTLQHRDQPLAGKKVWIQDEDTNALDDDLKSGMTDWYGRFSITWVAKIDRSETTREIRAVFEGDSSYGRDASPTRDMHVTKIGGDITLDPFPRTAKVGQAVTFSGTLSLGRGSPEGAVVYIKDEDSNDWDDLLVAAYVESDGRFSATWIAEHMDPSSTMEIFAVFEGDKMYYRQATCGDGCGDTVDLRIFGRVDPSPPVTQPGVPDRTQYMEMYYALNLRDPPHVAIVPNPDVYENVRSHMVPVQEGIKTWVYALERSYGGGNWDVTFGFVLPGDRFASKPDVVVNLITPKQDERCLSDWYGWALISKNPNKPIQTNVCSTYQEEKRSNSGVSRTAGHEFIHAMGLGHAFNKPGDVMCSREDTGPTCDLSVRKTAIPSSLNLGAVAKIYGTDGFLNPNNPVRYESRFAEGGSAGAQPVVQPPSAAPQKRTQSFSNGCTTDDKQYNITLKNYELKPGRYGWYTICNTGTIYYKFSTTDRDAGIRLYVLPPAADPRDYVRNGDGHPHQCEDTTKRWFSKSNTCYLRVGSSIVMHNDRDVPITINGRITTDVRQSFPNGCTTDEARYDFTVNGITLNPGASHWYTICNTGPMQYSFSTATRETGFTLHVLSPETDVRSYVNDDKGYRYTCEDPDNIWYSRSNTCNVSVGSRIVLQNDSDVPITINGWIRT